MKGWQKTSFIDYEGYISSVFFYGGCNFRCQYCHNKDLVLSCSSMLDISDDDVIKSITKKKELYEAVVLTGGEPTLSKSIKETAKKIKAAKFLVKLDTNGTNFQMLKELTKAKLVDYVAMDIKASWKKYPLVLHGSEKTKAKLVENIRQSIAFLKSNQVDYEFRSTVFPLYFQDDDLGDITDIVNGAKKYFLQQFEPKNTLVDVTNIYPFSKEKLKELQNFFSKYTTQCIIRGI